MATPTPGSAPASKRPVGGGGVSTPRSVPSPNATRHPAGKTPVNHPTTSSSHGSKTVSNTPMVQSLSQSGNSASPGITGLGIEGVTPGGLPTPLAFPMSRTDSEIRMSNNAAKRNEDEIRRAKMRKVLKSIGQPKGRVSEEGIARLARRVGMQTDIDDEKLTQEEKDRKVGNRSFDIAGQHSVIVTIDLKNQTPQSVEVNGIPEQEKAAKLLLRDLRDSGDVALVADLGHFALNLNLLAQLDRLSKETGTDCFAALGGLYSSLNRLYGKEREVAGEQQEAGRAEADAACKQSGRPMMHARQKLGLRVDFWQRNRHSSSEPDESAMDADQPPDDDTKDDQGIWTMLIGAEKYDARKLPCLSMRVSDQWLPEQINVPSVGSGEVLNWQEPAGDQQGMSGPTACFTVTFDPPIVLPYGTADAILKNFNIQQASIMQSIPSYASLLLASEPGNMASPSSSSGLESFSAEHIVLSMKDGDEIQTRHRYILDTAKPDFGLLLSEVPFSHPRQLVQLMPTLRQWVAFGSLARQAFHDGLNVESNDPSMDVSGLDSTAGYQRDNAITLDNLEQEAPETQDGGSLPINLTLSTSPLPTLNVTFRTTSFNPSVANIDIQILSNADVAVVIHDGFEFSDDEARSKAETRLAKALDVCWDLGVWIEWVRSQYA